MRPLLLSCLMLSAALLSGCSGPGDSTPPSADLPSEASLDQVGDPAVPAALSTQDGRTLKVLPVEEDGTLSPAAGLSKGGMAGLWLAGGGLGLYPSSFRHDIPGTVVAADLTMTWTPATGASPTLRLFFSPLEESNGGYSTTAESQQVEGESPLRLQLEDLGWDHGKYAVQAWWGGFVAHTPTGQEFHIEGTITYLE